MRTKTIQARHLHVGDEIVDGGDGKRRTAHRIGEVSVSKTGVQARVRKLDGGFEPRSFEPRDPIRIKVDDGGAS